MNSPLLQVEQLCVDYPTKRRQSFRAVDSVDLTVEAGQTVGLVGESGSGKSTIAKAVLGIAPVTAGCIRFDGLELDPLRVRRRKPITDIQAVFQDPVSSLDPTKTVGYTIAEPLLAKTGRQGRADVRRQVGEMIERVGLPASAVTRYPAQFSGGERQRIAIARALIVRPRLLICDEAVSALDLSIRAQILNLLIDLQREMRLSYLFISHDLGVVERIADRVVVLYRGRVMETGATAQVHRAPAHPYTRALLAAAPVSNPTRQRERRELRAEYRVRLAHAAPLGDRCPYTHRCRFAIEACSAQRPPLRPAGSGAHAACHRLDELDEADGAPDGSRLSMTKGATG